MIKITLIRPDGCGHCVAVKKTIENLKLITGNNIGRN